jgi:hypothetical protein
MEDVPMPTADDVFQLLQLYERRIESIERQIVEADARTRPRLSYDLLIAKRVHRNVIHFLNRLQSGKEEAV